jgi:hypothetical protein
MLNAFSLLLLLLQHGGHGHTSHAADDDTDTANTMGKCISTCMHIMIFIRLYCVTVVPALS